MPTEEETIREEIAALWTKYDEIVRVENDIRNTVQQLGLLLKDKVKDPTDPTKEIEVNRINPNTGDKFTDAEHADSLTKMLAKSDKLKKKADKLKEPITP